MGAVDAKQENGTAASQKRFFPKHFHKLYIIKFVAISCLLECNISKKLTWFFHFFLNPVRKRIMDNYLIALVLGLVEGITEFLPVSSSAHLELAGYLLNFDGERAHTFEIVIQLGAILAVVSFYWNRFIGLLFPRGRKGFYGLKGINLLILTTAPVCICGLLFHSLIKMYLFGPQAIIIFLIAGSLCMFLVEKRVYKPLYYDLDEITPKIALGIGLAQCVALCPGFSRSAATIMGALLMGAKRSLAVQYSFICAVPVMVAATAYDLYKNFSLFTAQDIPFFLSGCFCAYVAGLIGIRFFITLLGKITLVPFAIYRLLLSAAIWLFLIH